MTINLSGKLKNLQKEKAISQEKFADYLGVSFQAVSKWENDNTYPDISLLPEIARFFGITVDELLQVEKLDEKEHLMDCINFCTYWFFQELFYMACRIDNSETVPVDTICKKETFETVAKLYEVLYQNDDMDFESLQHLYLMYREIARFEITLANEEDTVKTHLKRAFACVKKSMSVQEHDLTLPMLSGWHIQAAPSDNKQWVRLMQADLEHECFDGYRDTNWFAEIQRQLAELL